MQSVVCAFDPSLTPEQHENWIFGLLLPERDGAERWRCGCVVCVYAISTCGSAPSRARRSEARGAALRGAAERVV